MNGRYGTIVTTVKRVNRIEPEETDHCGQAYRDDSAALPGPQMPKEEAAASQDHASSTKFSHPCA